MSATFLSPNIVHITPERPSVAVRELQILAFAMGTTVWAYKHDGDIAECEVRGFFYDARDMLNSGDLIAIRTPRGTGMRCVFLGPSGAPYVGAML